MSQLVDFPLNAGATSIGYDLRRRGVAHLKISGHCNPSIFTRIVSTLLLAILPNAANGYDVEMHRQDAIGSLKRLTDGEIRAFVKGKALASYISNRPNAPALSVENFENDGSYTSFGHHVRGTGTYEVRNAKLCVQTSSAPRSCRSLFKMKNDLIVEPVDIGQAINPNNYIIVKSGPLVH